MEIISPGAIGPAMKLAACTTPSAAKEGAGAGIDFTLNPTATVCGLFAAPELWTEIVPTYSPAARLATFTLAVTAEGAVPGGTAETVPEDGAADSQGWSLLAVKSKVPVPELLRLKVCA